MTGIRQIQSFIAKKLNRSNARSSNILKNIVASFAIKGVNIAVGFLIVPVTLGYVSTELYGIWLTLSSVMTWFFFFDMGLTTGLKNKLAEAISLHDYKKGRSLVSTTYGVLFLLMIPLCLLLLVSISYFDWCAFLNINISYQDEIRRTLYVLTGFFFLQMILNTLGTVVSAFQKTALSSLFTMLGQVLALVIIFTLTKLAPPSLVALCIAYMGAPIVVLLVASIYMYNSRFKIVAPSSHYFDRRYIKELLGIGLKFFLIQIQIIVLYQSTNIIISHLSNPETVAQYNTAYRYVTAAEMLFAIILTPIWPSFTEAYTKRDFDWMKSIYIKLTKVYGFIVLMIIFMIACSPFVYDIWLGDKITIPLAMTISIGVYTLIHSWVSLQTYMINGVGSIKLQVYVTLIGLIVHIPLSFFIGKYVGALGVVYSMTIIAFVYSLFFTVQMRKIINNKATGIWIE